MKLCGLKAEDGRTCCRIAGHDFVFPGGHHFTVGSDVLPPLLDQLRDLFHREFVIPFEEHPFVERQTAYDPTKIRGDTAKISWLIAKALAGSWPEHHARRYAMEIILKSSQAALNASISGLSKDAFGLEVRGVQSVDPTIHEPWVDVACDAIRAKDLPSVVRLFLEHEDAKPCDCFTMEIPRGELRKGKRFEFRFVISSTLTANVFATNHNVTVAFERVRDVNGVALPDCAECVRRKLEAGDVNADQLRTPDDSSKTVRGTYE